MHDFETSISSTNVVSVFSADRMRALSSGLKEGMGPFSVFVSGKIQWLGLFLRRLEIVIQHAPVFADEDNHFRHDVDTVTTSAAIDITTDRTLLSVSGGTGITPTLAAPGIQQLGRTKTISMIAGDGTNTATIALTNCIGGSASTSALFNAAGETLELKGVQTGPSTYRWLVIKEHGVTLS